MNQQDVATRRFWIDDQSNGKNGGFKEKDTENGCLKGLCQTLNYYVCPVCKKHVGCHKGTNIPLDYPADDKTREPRKEVHDAFDASWKKSLMPRDDAYAWLSRHLGIDLASTHIGMFNEKMCEQALAIIQSSC